MRTVQLFLSYSRDDLALATSLRQQVEEQGHQVWQDTEQLLAGDSIDAKLRRTLRASDAYMILLTPNSLKSTWVMIELGGAWLSGIRLFPVIAGVSAAELPGPLRDLNFCQFSEVPRKLFPALITLANELVLPLPAASERERMAIAGEAAQAAQIGHYSAQVATLVAQALAVERGERRIAHTAMRNGAPTLRAAFLNTMAVLTVHAIDRVRGEAYFCLGDIPLDDTKYAKDETFFQQGLFDESIWVQGCCANVLKNFAPLEHATVDRLEECLTANIYRMQTTGPLAALVYYSSVALNSHHIRSRGGHVYAPR
jgi:hypothetical protein